jgi:uncharacterized protein
MNYEASLPGRIFTIRLSENDPVYDSIKTIARKENVKRAVLWMIGGVKNGRVVVGAELDDERPIKPMQVYFPDSREVVGVGTLFPDESGEPSLHIHASLGKTGTSITGCPRLSLDCWLITEIIMQEISSGTAIRKADENGFHLLTIG